jgi:hypothetical protein
LQSGSNEAAPTRIASLSQDAVATACSRITCEQKPPPPRLAAKAAQQNEAAAIKLASDVDLQMRLQRYICGNQRLACVQSLAHAMPANMQLALNGRDATTKPIKDFLGCVIHRKGWRPVQILFSIMPEELLRAIECAAVGEAK